MAEVMSKVALVVTYGGMRAMEAACIGVPSIIQPRNEGERLNAEFLRAGGKIDGLGCKRAADAIEELVK
jgi:UDP-N-acetylglucosamine:LPS N-acetylglucosamine transferase